MSDAGKPFDGMDMEWTFSDIVRDVASASPGADGDKLVSLAFDLDLIDEQSGPAAKTDRARVVKRVVDIIGDVVAGHFP